MTQQRCCLILLVEVVHILTCFLLHVFVLLLDVLDSHIPLEAFTIICLIPMQLISSADEYVACFANKFQTFCPPSVSLTGFCPGFVLAFTSRLHKLLSLSSCLYSAWNLISFGLPVPSGQGKIFHSLNIFFRLLLCHCRIL